MYSLTVLTDILVSAIRRSLVLVAAIPHSTREESEQMNYGHHSEGSGVPGWLIWVGVLIGVNVLSYVFDWPFWIY